MVRQVHNLDGHNGNLNNTTTTRNNNDNETPESSPSFQGISASTPTSSPAKAKGKPSSTFLGLAIVSILGILLAASIYNPITSSSISAEVASYPSFGSGLSRIFGSLRALAGVGAGFLTTTTTVAAATTTAGASGSLTSISTAANNNISTIMANKRMPVYFVSHGGPTTMYKKDHPVYPQLQAIGREITEKIKPAAVVVFSAHWQAERPNTIEVNVAEEEPLIYDFYGFPRHYYSEKFPNKGSPELARKVISLLNENGIKTQEAERGLDHGVFVPFKVMFDPKENPLTVPIVQVSLFDDDTNAGAHIALGRAVQKLRDQNVLVIGSGMSVHNLRHYMMVMATGQTMPYAPTFDNALKEAVETPPGEKRDEKMIKLLTRPDARQAHPTFEHLLPIHIAVGAAGPDPGKQLWTLAEGSMGWAQYKFEQVESQ
ncbi:hypothetical protein ABEF95_002352 [Exophiala dermatitidis]